jgi:hypothetical protein
MVITLQKLPAGSPKMARTVRQPLDPRFNGGMSGQAKNALVTDIKGIEGAKKLHGVFGRVLSDLKIWGFSINDWASRVNTLLAVYAPALYFSLVPEKKHFWETNGRNALIWLTTLGVTILTKHEKVGVNALLNHVMPQKKGLKVAEGKNLGDKIGRLWQKGLDTLRPKYDYYEMLHKAGVLTEEQTKDVRNKAANKWCLDNNQIEQLKMKMEQIADKLKNNKAIEGMSKDKAEAFVKNVPKLMNRMSNMKMAALAANMAATIFVIGIWAMDIVFKYIAPHDPDFDVEKYRKFNKKSDDKKSDNQPTASIEPPGFTPKPTDILNGPPQAPVSFGPNPPLGALPGAFPSSQATGVPVGLPKPFNLPPFSPMVNSANMQMMAQGVMPGGRN